MSNETQPDGQPQSRAVEITTDEQAMPDEEVPITSPDPPSGYGYGIFKRQMRYDPLMIVFTILVFVGGMIGYFTKGSTPSLVAGTVFALLLAVSTFLEGTRKNPYPLLATLFALGGMMAYRYYSNPGTASGLVALGAFLMAARHIYLFYLRSRTV